MDKQIRDQQFDFGVSISQFGATGDGSDDTQAFLDAIDKLGGKAGTIILNGTKTYGIKNTVIIPHNVSIEGNLAKIIPLSGGTLTGGFLFYVNSTLQNSTIVKWGGEQVPTIQNLKFENPHQLSDAKAFYTRGKTNFRNITFRGVYKGILKEGFSDGDYSDMMHLEKLYFVNCMGTDPLIDIKYNGDGLFIDRCHTAGAADSNFNLLNLEYCNGGKIAGCINGDIRINKSMGVSIENFHCEHGKIHIISSQVTLRDIYHWYHKDYQPIPLTITGAANDKPSMPCIIENYAVIHLRGRTDQSKNYTDPDYFDAYFKNTNVKITNFFRRPQFALDPSFGMATAAKISFDGIKISEQWENASPLYSKDSYISDSRIFTSINEAEFTRNFVLFGVPVTNHTSFDEAAGTYYYQAVYYFGPVDREVGRWGGGEQSAHVTNPAVQVPYLNVSYRPEMQLSKIRLYRGKMAGQYTHWVDIPVGNGVHVYDLGYFLSTGERWKTRSAGPVGSFNSTYTKIRMEGDNVAVTGPAIPTQGSWKKGDRVVNENRAELGTVGTKYIVDGWECITAGAPGVWVERRFLTGN